MFLLTAEVSAQKLIDKVTNLFEFELGSKDREEGHYHTKFVLAPVLSYEPATNLGFGVGSKLLFKPRGAGDETRTSNIPLAILYTLNNQFIFTSSYDVFFPQEKWLLKGRLGFSKYPVGYFGIGRNSVMADKQEISFNQILIEPLLLRKVADHVFVGAGIRYFQTYDAKFTDDDHPVHPDVIKSLNARSLGLEFATTVDSRDNVLNASKGTFLEFTHGVYTKAAGSTNDFMLSKVDYRKYFQLNPDKLNIIAMHLYTRLTWRNPSVLEHSTLGGAELLRGFPEGRFRDRFAYFTQVEYRWQTFRRVGFVFFGGAGDIVGEGDRFDFGQLKYSLGTGIRLKIVKSENLNIRLDYAFGFYEERDSNFYLGIAEAF